MIGSTNASGSGSDIDVGFIMAWYGANDPESGNWLICDGRDTTGTAIELATVYPRLYRFLGNSNVLPNLKGEFLRGAGTNSHTGQGNGGTVGTHQDSTTVFGTYLDPSGNNYSVGYGGSYGLGRNEDARGDYSSKYISISCSSSRSTINEYCIRPTNTSVNWAIKAR